MPAIVPTAERIVRGVQHPRRVVRGLRRRVVRAVRARRAAVGPGAGGAAPAGRGGTGTGTPAKARTDLGGRLVGVSAVRGAGHDRPVLAVVGDEDGGALWANEAHVVVLRPNDALAVLATVAPDALVVRADAGRSGPWRGTGTYDRPERDRMVLDLVDAAREKGIRTILCSSAGDPQVPMLTDLAPEFDLVAPLEAPVHPLLPAAARETS